MRQILWEIGLLKFFECELIQLLKDLLDPLIQIWRVEERAFDIRGVMIPLQLHDVYFLIELPIREIREETHLSLAGQSTLELLMDHDYGVATNAISDGSLYIARIMGLTTQVMVMMVLLILYSIATHWVTSGKMRMVERALEGSMIAWVSLMLTCIYEQLGCCVGGPNNFVLDWCLYHYFLRTFLHYDHQRWCRELGLQ